MKDKDILEGLLGKFIYFELQGRNRGYSKITKVDSVEFDEDNKVLINGEKRFELDQAIKLINTKCLNDSISEFALNRIYKLSDKIEEDFNIYEWGNN
jgi:hypothetical protein